MKEVPKKHLPEVSGGQIEDGGCIPGPDFPLGEYPHNPIGPYDVPSLEPGHNQA